MRMNQMFFIRVEEDLDRSVEWTTGGSVAGKPVVGRGSLADAARTAADKEVVVLVPANCVTLAEAEIPTRNRAQLLKAIPYTLEEELAENVEDLHFAVKPHGNGKTDAAVVRRDWMERLLAMLQEAGVIPRAVTPETLCLPRQGDEWVLLAEDRGAVFRTGRNTGYALDNEQLDILVDAALAAWTAHGQTASALTLIERRTDPTLPPLGLTSDVSLTNYSGDEPAIAVLAQGYLAQRPINLLQGDFAPTTNFGEAWRRWRVAAMIVLLLGTVHLVTLAIENVEYRRQIEGLDQAMATLYRETFPDATKVINPVAQMRNHMAELQQQGGPSIDYLALVVGAGKLVVGADQVSIKRLRYRDNRIELDLESDSIERLETLQQHLREANFLAELRSVTNNGGRYQGRIDLGGGEG